MKKKEKLWKKWMKRQLKNRNWELEDGSWIGNWMMEDGKTKRSRTLRFVIRLFCMPYKPVKSFQDLDVYQRLYSVMIQVHKQILPALPSYEKFGLIDQMRRASKAPPALLAEGFAKRHHQRSWHKYLQDCIGECNEMINHLSVCRDLHVDTVDITLCATLIEEYTIASKQLHTLIITWQNFSRL